MLLLCNDIISSVYRQRDPGLTKKYVGGAGRLRPVPHKPDGGGTGHGNGEDG